MLEVSRTSFLRFLLFLALFLCPRLGRAQDEAAIEACFSAYEETQVHLKAHHYQKARELARACSTGCPQEIMEQCQTWAWEAERGAPSVILVARYDNGEDAPGITATVDGEWRPLQKELLLDPGPHELTFKRDDGWTYELSVTIHPGEKRRTIRAEVPDPVSVEKPPPPIVEPQARSHLPWAIVSFSVGAVGFGAAGAFTAVALSQKSSLDDCAPVCSEGDVNRAHQSLLMADVGLVVGAIGLATGVSIFIWGKPKKTSPGTNLKLSATAGGLGTTFEAKF